MNAGTRCDVFYSFFGVSIKKEPDELKAAGVKLCMAKCPDFVLPSAWHVRNKKMAGVDYTAIYQRRANWWFCDTYIPTVPHFMRTFELLDKHIPTTGFSAIMDIVGLPAKSIYLTGFDFFDSRVHNVDERWRPGNPKDPIGHRPDLEKNVVRNLNDARISVDKRLEKSLG